MREITETVLELVGLLLLVAAAAVWAGTVATPAGLAVAGAGLLGVSALSGIAGRKRKRSR